MATYCVDADIVHWDPLAATYLPSTDAGLFTRLRENAYEEIGRRLARREPPVDQASLGAFEGALHAERLWVLYKLYYDAAAQVATDDSGLKKRSDDYLALFETEMENIRIPVDDDVNGITTYSSVQCVPIWRR